MSTAQQAFDRFRPETAWEPYYPHPGNPWDEVKAAHLYRRAALAPAWHEIQAARDAAPGRIVAQLLAGGEGHDDFEREARRLERGALSSGEPREVKGAWLHRFLHSPHPLQERMTLFWHNHFATSHAKVGDLRLMQRQIDLFRRHALGHFGELLQAVTRDPAMLIWLDADGNRQGQPNENYARELFELFGLGAGHYSEDDIKEAARALTGWTVQGGRAVLSAAEHDRGEKTILGRRGAWSAGDLVRIVLEQPACARHLARKLFHEFVSETVEPSDAMLEPLAEGFRLRDYDVGWLVERLLRSWVFFSPAALGQKVKSPVEFAAGSVRSLEGRLGPLRLASLCDQLGQALYHPPSVKGWDGGSAWLSSTALLHRQNFAFELTRGTGSGRDCDPARIVRKYGVAGDEELARFFLRLFHQRPDHEALPQIAGTLEAERAAGLRQFYSPEGVEGVLARTAAHLALTLPEYQLS